MPAKGHPRTLWYAGKDGLGAGAVTGCNARRTVGAGQLSRARAEMAFEQAASRRQRLIQVSLCGRINRAMATRFGRLSWTWKKRMFAAFALAVGGCATLIAPRDPAIQAEARAIRFLQREVPAWSRDNGCFSCHNNGDAARALYAAVRKGYRIPRNVLADTTAWVKAPGRWDENKGDPGFSDKRLANVQFAAALLAAVETGHVNDRQSLREAVRKVAADQNPDGAWRIEPGGAVGSPATYGTTLATYLGLKTLRAMPTLETAPAIRKAEDWLERAAPNNVPDAATLLLASRGDAGASSRQRRDRFLDSIRRAQTGEGGWGPYADSPPEAFDTALVLLAVAELREDAGIRESVERGRRFLVGQQNADGSWPATTRPPGCDSYAQRVSTTAWVTLALLATRE